MKKESTDWGGWNAQVSASAHLPVDGESAVKGWARCHGVGPVFENQAQIHGGCCSERVFVELDQKTITDAPVKAEDSETFHRSCASSAFQGWLSLHR